jgi:hypothetical protein
MFLSGTSHRQNLEPGFLCSDPGILEKSDRLIFQQHLQEHLGDRGVAYRCTLHRVHALQQMRSQHQEVESQILHPRARSAFVQQTWYVGMIQMIRRY